MNWFVGKDAVLEREIDADSADGVATAIRDGANANAKGQHGVTPLEYAIGHQRKAAFKQLLQLKADSGQRDDEKDNAMTLATKAFSRDPDYLRLALESGGDPNTLQADGDPILARFVHDRDLGAIRFMKNHGADLNLRDRSGDPLIISAATTEFWDVVWCLLELGAKYNYPDEPYGWREAFNKPWATPQDSPLWPDKVKSWRFLKQHGVDLANLPGLN